MRKYQPSANLGNRRCQWSIDDMRRAVNAVKRGKSLSEAAEEFSVPKSTLAKRVKNPSELSARIGRPRALSETEESCLVQGLLLCAEWGFPLTCLDVQNCVFNYLKSIEKVVQSFNNNIPSRDWVNQFMQRNPILTTRLATNIKRSRAAITSDIVSKYFDNLELELEGINPAAIVNYDETNLKDDPGAIKVIARRGVRHVETIVDSSKQSTSIMVSVAGNGHLLPLHVVYKSKYVYPSWIEGGPPGTRYSASESGWFNMSIFEEWFELICVPYLKKFEGKKAVIGDNLSSHLSLKVLKLCEENNIKFLLLPPNSTHLTQPLDVAWFAPMKKEWRRQLLDWKRTHHGAITKAAFPFLLNNCIESLGLRATVNVISGFRACGIVPLDKNAVLKRLPQPPAQLISPEEVGNSWANTLVTHLQTTRANVVATAVNSNNRGQKLAAGKSVSAEEITSQNDRSKPSKTTKRKAVPDPQTEEEVLEEFLLADNEVEVLGQEGNKKPSKKAKKIKNTTGPNKTKSKDVLLGNDKENVYPQNPNIPVEKMPEFKDKDFVAFNSMGKFCVARIVDITGDEVEVDCLRKFISFKENYFVFPHVPDVIKISKQNIFCKLDAKDIRRGRFSISSLPLPLSQFL
ncbi:Jerky protein homolog-like [Frankliniella fusca]|uniref:Jerky protein homolog-like n=1 Tax=Frankliniella fusca TaxID=407009 RepID=A0AAE1HLJ7_9NEOP|nr:Jerky protein homolog-like [Frankliniella fusca]